MTLIEWKPKNSLLNYFNGIDRMFDNVFAHNSEMEYGKSCFTPSMDVVEHPSEYIILLDLPGVEKKDVEINSSEGVLTVIGRRKCLKDVENNSYSWRENQYGSFKRSFELPLAIKEDKIKANFKNGVLTLIAPKVEEVKPTMKKIAIS